ncbi:hypothetical protein M438DRAFT_79155 [Aureobasidium pullulans EXF-150]|uniref:Zn(2)-C6 fungal-type domain-containing protein n=1 Tax=Aureobasidium pullulans EXF-150 TaxID=1043002 RepID=A0A074XRF0_AURPU|nr:uncharacterized protein M438DRAFT_79155 [Aureobasidium pullulans EXF-150]KEQ88178.1 hypothetical protein M438DRAFT_79155 [Aureobasidium pullulans EXF-150]
MPSVSSDWKVERPPRRSGQRSANGCLQCRKRKVKCDEQKPTCSYCERRKLSCSWFQRPWKFVDVSDKVSEEYDVLSGPSEHQSQQQRNPIELNPIEYVPKRQHRTRERPQETEGLETPSSSTSSSGSNSSPQDLTSTKPRHYGVNSSQKTRIPPSVDAGPTTRSQMLIVALYHYLPTNEPKEHRGEHEHPRLTFLNLFNGAIFRPRAPFLAAAIDSFTLVQASLALGDVRLGFAAIRRYSACLSKFNAALAESNLYSHDDILLCMLVLSILESIRPISQFGGWASHVRGAIKYLEDRGPRLLKTRYQTVLFHHAKQASVLWGIFHQEPIPFSGKDWLRISESAPFINHETRLIDIGIRIPGLLSPSSYLSSPTDMSGYQTYFQDLLATSYDIQKWLAGFHRQRDVLLHACDETNFPTYFRLVKRNVLSTASSFRDFNDAWYLSTAWTYLYLLQTTCLSIMHSGLPLHFDVDAASLVASVESTVDNLTKTVPQALSAQSGFSGRLSVNLFLRMITLHYEAQGRDEMVGWCGDIESALYTPDQGHAGAWMANWERVIKLPRISQFGEREQTVSIR